MFKVVPQYNAVMKRLSLAALFAVIAWGWACGQNSHPDVYGYDEVYYKDSITESHYPRMFRLSPGSLPFVPLPESGTNYSSPLGEYIIAPADTIRCVVEIIYDSKKNCHTKSYGIAWLNVKRFKDGKIQPYGVLRTQKWLKRKRKRLKFKLELVMKDALGGKTKVVTAKVNYDAICPRNTEIKYNVKDYDKSSLPADATEESYGFMKGEL